MQAQLAFQRQVQLVSQQLEQPVFQQLAQLVSQQLEQLEFQQQAQLVSQQLEQLAFQQLEERPHQQYLTRLRHWQQVPVPSMCSVHRQADHSQ
ncbi:MAG: hypothetical protein ACK526_06970 [Planctomyces sp.]